MDSVANRIRWTVSFVSDPSAILKLNCGISGDSFKRVHKFKVHSHYLTLQNENIEIREMCDTSLFVIEFPYPEYFAQERCI
jgi:hypothetical protein